jgi:hypothetical protein
MRYGNDDEYPFDTDNRAWQQLLAVASEHFEVLTWTREGDGRPMIITLAHAASGDLVSLAVMDSREVTEPHVLLAVHTDGRLTAHGPGKGPATAQEYGPVLALTDATTAATVAVPLHDPTEPSVPDAAWRHVPDNITAGLRTAPADTRTGVVVLLDRAGQRLAVAGPFADEVSATVWTPAEADEAIEQLLVPLVPILPDRRS